MLNLSHMQLKETKSNYLSTRNTYVLIPSNHHRTLVLLVKKPRLKRSEKKLIILAQISTVGSKSSKSKLKDTPRRRLLKRRVHLSFIISRAYTAS